MFEGVIRDAPKNPVGYTQMGRILMAQKKEKEGLERFEQALAAQPGYLESLQFIVAYHMSKKEPRKALERVQKHAGILTGNPFIYSMLGNVFEANGDIAGAEANLKKAVELGPNVPALYVSLANFYMRQKTLDKAKKQYLDALGKAPDALSALMALAMIYESEKDYAKAQEYYEKVLKIRPDFPPAANNLAYIYAEHGGNIDVALNLAQKAKEQVPDDPHISDTLGWLYYRKNVPGRAVAYIREAEEKVPNEPLIKYHLGMAYYKNGNREMAKKTLAEALKLRSDFPGAEEARTTLQNISK
jgi:tetratricopeptide (TPR) repeat protein